MQNHTQAVAGCQGPVAAGPTLSDVARSYVARGWSIIPIKAGTKKPTCKWTKYQAERATEAEIAKWFGNGQDVGLAVVFGDISDGLVARDFDTMQGYQRWAADHPDLAKTLPTVATARGRHVYFRSNHRGIVTLEDGELRGAGYCLLPPTQHPDGPVYCWLVPLPDGPLPLVEDVQSDGFLGACNVTERTECTEGTERTDDYSGEQKQLAGDLLEKVIEAVIIESLPSGVGERNRQVFELARALKAVPALADAPADTLEPYVRRWHSLGVKKGVIGTEPFEETRIDFLLAWPKVMFPKGAKPMTKLFEAAKRVPLPEAAMRYEADGLRLLVALCRELQRVSGDKPFYLACRTAGGLLGVKHVTAWRWLVLLTHDKIVEEVEKGDRLRRRASRYRYLADNK